MGIQLQYTASAFGDTVLGQYEKRQRFSKGQVFAHEVRAAASDVVALGHPEFEQLGIGEKRTIPMTAMFIDLRDFTGRTFWDPQDQVTDLAHAVLAGFIETVLRHGGYPLGLRGDGLFAGFGPGNAQLGAACALAAGAFALNAVKEEVNPRLEQRGIARVQARAGLDFGDVTFVRTGSSGHSEINPVGFAANFASKCEKQADSWEIVTGEKLAKLFPEAEQFTKLYPPKTYTRDYVTQTYHYYDYRWRGTLPHSESLLEELAGNPISAVSIG
ncbi:adenylate/guanylate cyclase domain-containing protein [Pseudoclavibacter helvolus]|uniref:adenylate/guanylate cyclase domain-containing protein n=1 Tax=Pseudoclavibacter helvolus TaxID=255205 RepID=UPI0024AD55DF|nr:adenylate/guanylate cyclase domain-containing protein [Pseudoclavibacter helvolus]